MNERSRHFQITVSQHDRVCPHHAPELREANDPVPVPVHNIHHLLRLLHAAHLTEYKLHLISCDASILILAEHSKCLLVAHLQQQQYTNNEY